MSNGKPYSLFKRGRVFYASFKLPNGKWSTAKSTGETARSRAERWAHNYCNAGQIVVKENVSFEKYSRDFFSWEGAWAIDKRARGLRVSRRQCYNLTYLLTNHLSPTFGKYMLTEINRAIIKEYRNKIYSDGYSGNSINKILSALKAILGAAEEEGLVQFVPKIDRAAVKSTTKGVLTVEEVQKLFAVEWKSDPTHCHPAQDQFKGYAGNLLSCTSGLRMGEIRALVLSDVHLEEGYIHVRRSWDKHFGMNETTKTGRARNILIPSAVQDVLRDLIAMNPEPGNPESFVFFGDKDIKKPVEPIVFSRSLYGAMRKIGISEEERKERVITFHSWRHWFNSLLINAKVPIQKIQSLTGHLTLDMVQHYYHLDDMDDVKYVQESIFIN
jgi:integrase